MDKTKPDFYMVNFLRDDVLDEEGALVEEAPKVTGIIGQWLAGKLPTIEGSVQPQTSTTIRGRRHPTHGGRNLLKA